MSCDVSPEMLGAFFDSELGAAESAALSAHVESCPRCRPKLAELGALSASLHDPSFFHPIPLELVRRTRASQLAGGSAAPSPRASLRYLAAAAALAAAFLLGGVVVPRFSAGGGPAASELVSAHLRSLAPGRLFDVASTDQHTVKPWFAGKLDFAPAVPLLASDGFELLGGRVEVIDGHSAAALVYRRRKHTINVFLWPDASSREREIAPSTVRGLNVAGWEHAGFRGYAVSDLNAKELGSFTRLFRSRE